LKQKKNKPISLGSSIRIRKSIFIFAGKGNGEMKNYPIESVDRYEKDEIESIHLLGNYYEPTFEM